MKATMPNEPLSAMTVLELTRLLLAQDSRWADIVTHAQNTRNPAAPAGIAFFKRTWRPVISDYFLNVVPRYDSVAKAPARVVTDVLDKMSDVIYPAARKVGFSDTSFVLPDITIERADQARPAVAGARVGIEADSRGKDAGIGTKIAFAGFALVGLGLAYYVRDVRKLASTLPEIRHAPRT